MASRIQGITVEIGGDTTKLSKALESVNKSIKGTQSGLKDVNKLLKLDPSNTELVVQKQKMLKDAIEATKEKLATLKTAAQQANEQLANGEITQQQYDALQREIVETEQNLRSLQDQAATTNATLAKIDEAGEKLQNIGSSVENARLYEAAFRRHQERRGRTNQPDQVDGSKGAAGYGGHQFLQSAGTDPAALRWLWLELPAGGSGRRRYHPDDQPWWRIYHGQRLQCPER